MKRLYLKLFHGRIAVDEELDDWGFDGPYVGPLDFIQNTYNTNIRYSFERSAIGAKNALVFGLALDDDDILIEYVDGMTKFDGFYFGDWSATNFSDAEAKAHNDKWFATERLKELSRQAETTRLAAGPTGARSDRIMQPTGELDG